MTKNELISFVKKFNQAKAIPMNIVMDGLKELSPSDHELFFLLINYKNEQDFKNKLEGGEI